MMLPPFCLFLQLYLLHLYYTTTFHAKQALKSFFQIWQARSFGAKRHQAETLTSPRLLLDGAFPIPHVTQISSVAARCAIAIFPRAAARWSAGSVRPAPADRRRSPCGSAAPASAPAHGGTRRRPPFSLP